MHSYCLVEGRPSFHCVLILVLMEDALVLRVLTFHRPNSSPVLILVLMEDALVHRVNLQLKAGDEVLILVLMEDALVHCAGCCSIIPIWDGLNPCFNGRCTRTLHFYPGCDDDFDGLNPCFNGRCTRTHSFLCLITLLLS